MNDVHAMFLSTEYRMRMIKQVRDTGGIPFLEGLEFEIASPFLHFNIRNLQARPNIILERLYYQPKTHTFVHQAKDPASGHRIVFKTYPIKTAALKVANAVGQHDVEIRYLRLLAFFLLANCTPHVTLPIGRTFLSKEDVSHLLSIHEDIPDGMYHVILSEHVTTSLTPIVQALSPYALKVLIFQTVFTLATIQKTIPSFRHNDLHLSNVLVQQMDKKGLSQKFPKRNVCTRYKFLNTVFYHDLGRCSKRALLWDFYFSTIDARDAAILGLEQVVNNRFVKTSMASKNQYYDLHKFFDSLEYALGDSIRPDVRVLVDFVVPSKYKCMSKQITPSAKKDLALSDVRLMTAAELLQNAYFDELKQPPERALLITKYDANKNPFV